MNKILLEPLLPLWLLNQRLIGNQKLLVRCTQKRVKWYPPFSTTVALRQKCLPTASKCVQGTRSRWWVPGHFFRGRIWICTRQSSGTNHLSSSRVALPDFASVGGTRREKDCKRFFRNPSFRKESDYSSNTMNCSVRCFSNFRKKSISSDTTCIRVFKSFEEILSHVIIIFFNSLILNIYFWHISPF